MSTEDSNHEIIHKEIDLIQACITRMANNSFLLKGWSVSLITVVMTIFSEKVNFVLIIGLLSLITVSFWYLDAFFLRTEKMYRKLYEWAIKERIKGNYEKLYDLDPHGFINDVDSICRVMFSKTLWVFYSMPLIIMIILLFLKYPITKN